MRKPNAVGVSIVRFSGSYGLACVLFLFLLLLTFLGTLEQVRHGIYEVQNRYFASFIAWHDVFGLFNVPLPGAFLLLILLSVNVLVGGIIRARKDWSRLGVIVVHLGILVLLAGSFAKHQMAHDGAVTLYEGDTAQTFSSYYDYEIAVAKPQDDGALTEYLIADDGFSHLGADATATFTNPEWPFDVVVTGYAQNSAPQPGAPPGESEAPVDGFYLASLPRETETAYNMPGAYVTLRGKESGQEHHGILWSQQRHPFAAEIGGTLWSVDLRRAQYKMPFEITLDKFTRELHPRTNIASVYSSEVTKTEGESRQKFLIEMNQPLRHKGYTIYQSGWGPQNARPGDPLFSTLAVVSDPVEQVPLYASLIITVGLLFHYGLKLFRYLRSETRRTAAA